MGFWIPAFAGMTDEGVPRTLSARVEQEKRDDGDAPYNNASHKQAAGGEFLEAFALVAAFAFS